jgi:hypothetical protein
MYYAMMIQKIRTSIKNTHVQTKQILRFMIKMLIFE